jgi:predicted MFS family arabinose efflux permease
LQPDLDGDFGQTVELHRVDRCGLVSEHAGWADAWLWSAAISACGFVAVALLVNQGPLARSGVVGREPAPPRDRALIKIIVAYGLFGFGYVVTATFLVAIVRQGGGSRLFEAMVWLVAGLAGVPSVWLWQRFAARIGLHAAYALACLVEVVGVTASVALGGNFGPLLAGLLLGGTFIAITAFGLQAARLRAPQAPQRTFALMTASFGLGQIIGPVAAGLLAQMSGDFVLASVVAAAALVVSGAVTWSAAPKSP